MPTTDETAEGTIGGDAAAGTLAARIDSAVAAGIASGLERALPAVIDATVAVVTARLPQTALAAAVQTPRRTSLQLTPRAAAAAATATAEARAAEEAQLAARLAVLQDERDRAAAGRESRATVPAGGSGRAAQQPIGGAGAGGVGCYTTAPYRWPMHRLLNQDVACALLNKPELCECVPGYDKLSVAEQFELTYWYGVGAKLADVVEAVKRGEHTADAGIVATLQQCNEQAPARIVYLVQVAASAGGFSEHTRAYWQQLSRQALSDAQDEPIPGAMGAAHAATQTALRAARAKATANAELARLRRGGGGGGNGKNG